MKAKPFSILKKLAVFFVTPLTYEQLKQWKFYTIYILIIIPAILIAYNSINRYHREHVRYDRMNENIAVVSDKKKHKLSNNKEHYLEFVQITKQDECLKYLSEKEAGMIYSKKKITNEKWLQCINKNTIVQRVNNFISSKSALLDSFYKPAITFEKFSAITHKTMDNSVQYSSAVPKTQEFFTVLPVKLKFKSTLKKALEYMKNIGNECSSCQIFIHKLNKTKTNNNYDIILMVKINLDMQTISSTNKLSKLVSAGMFSGNNLSGFAKEHPHLL